LIKEKIQPVSVCSTILRIEELIGAHNLRMIVDVQICKKRSYVYVDNE
jgi:hypothetical protein